MTIWERFAALVLRCLPFNLPPLMVAIVLAFVLLFLLPFILWQCTAKGAELELSGGVATIRGPAPALGLKVIAPGVVTDHGDIGCGLMLIGNSTDRGQYQPVQGALHCQIISRFEGLGVGLDRLSAGLGAAVLQHDDVYNAGKFNFSLMLEVRAWDRLYIGWQHFSNAGSASPNLGRDIAFAAWRFK